jgi:hypothetical protein
MPVIVTTVHDPRALIATCAQLGLDPPREGSLHLDGREIVGWVVRLPGLHAPLVCATLRGLIGYHCLDNVPHRYAQVMRFIRRYYDIKAGMDRADSDPLAPLPPVVPASESA